MGTLRSITMDTANRRLNRVCAHIHASEAASAKDSLTVTDNRTGETYDVAIVKSVEEAKPGMVKAMDFKRLRMYDPGYTNTASATSRITWIDGDKGQLLFMIPRCAGWLSHWVELQDDPELKIIRPRQQFLGSMGRTYEPMSQRKEHDYSLKSYKSAASVRRG